MEKKIIVTKFAFIQSKVKEHLNEASRAFICMRATKVMTSSPSMSHHVVIECTCNTPYLIIQGKK